MKVVITGASGQVGRALLASVPPNVKVVPFSHHELDISSYDEVGAALERESPELIVNAAAYTAVDRAEQEPELARAANRVGPYNLAKVAATVGARLIHISTDFVFDGRASSPYRPDSPTNPLNVYGQTKRDGEIAVLSELGERAVVLRSSWVYAASGGNFLSTMLRLMKNRGAVRVVADQVGVPTAANSLAKALWKIAVIEQLCGIYHWSDSGVASWYDFAVAIAEEAVAISLLPDHAQVTPIATEDYPTLARRPSFSVLNTQSTQRAIGQEPPHWRVNLRSVLMEISRA
jgi:dTDP-4-dehydrorhamnose reductase